MEKLPQQSDTKRDYNKRSPYQVPDTSRKNYRSLIVKIILVLVIIIILIVICVILILLYTEITITIIIHLCIFLCF